MKEWRQSFPISPSNSQVLLPAPNRAVQVRDRMFVTNALQGYGHMGAYLGLFNGTICIPQIVAALVGGAILSLVGSVQSNMMIVAGVFLIIGALCVAKIKEKKQEM